MESNEQGRRLTVQEVAEREGVKEQTVRNWYKRYGLPYRQIATGPVTIFERELDTWLQQHHHTT